MNIRRYAIHADGRLVSGSDISSSDQRRLSVGTMTLTGKYMRTVSACPVLVKRKNGFRYIILPLFIMADMKPEKLEQKPS